MLKYGVDSVLRVWNYFSLGWGRLGLLGRLVFSIALITMIGASIQTYFFIKGGAAEYRRYHKEYALETSSSLHDSIINTFVYGEHEAVKKLLDSRARKSRDIGSLVWVDPEGNTHEADSKLLPIQAPKWFVRWLDIPIFHYSQRIVQDNNYYGILELIISPNNAHNRLWNIFKNHVQIISLVMLFVFMSITALLRSHLQNLKRMSIAVGEFSAGNYSIRLEPQGAPEMRRMVEAFNEMAGEIQKQIQFTEALISAFPNPVFYKDTEGHYLGVNKAWVEFFGIAEADAIGKTVRQLCKHAPQLADLHEKMDEELWNHPGVQAYESLVITPNDRHYQTLYSKATFSSLDGKTAGLIGTIIDFTGIKEAEDKAQRALVDKLSAEASNRAKSAFLATMSHELRTPLNSVILLSEWLLSGINESHGISENFVKYTETISSSAQHLLSVINNILDFAQIESGRFEFSKSYFDIHKLLATVVNIVFPQVKAKNLQLFTHISDSVPENIVTDKVRLQQILLNLLSNSVKFTEKGEINLRVDLITIGKLANLKIEVADEGIGIPKSAQGKIFNLFEQADQSITQRYGGTGLGLAITKEIVERLQGEIIFVSEEGKGSIFTASIPVETGQPYQMHYRQAEESYQLPASVKPLKILVAEDDPINQFVIKELLENRGHHVDLAVNGEQALAALSQQNYDVAILDYNMPIKNGFAVAEDWRCQEQEHHLKIIVLTADVTISIPDRYRDFVDIIEYKPINTVSFLRVVESGKVLSEIDTTESVEDNSEQTETSLLDTDRLSQTLSRQKNKRDYVNRLISLLNNNYPGQITEIRDSLQRGEIDKARKTMHNMKGGALYLGATALTNELIKFESIDNALLKEQADQIVEQLNNLIDITSKALQNYADQCQA